MKKVDIKSLKDSINEYREDSQDREIINKKNYFKVCFFIKKSKFRFLNSVVLSKFKGD